MTNLLGLIKKDIQQQLFSQYQWTSLLARQTYFKFSKSSQSYFQSVCSYTLYTRTLLRVAGSVQVTKDRALYNGYRCAGILESGFSIGTSLQLLSYNVLKIIVFKQIFKVSYKRETNYYIFSYDYKETFNIFIGLIYRSSWFLRIKQ